MLGIYILRSSSTRTDTEQRTVLGEFAGMFELVWTFAYA